MSHTQGHRPGCNSDPCDHHADKQWAKHHPPACSNSNPRPCIVQAARRFGQDVDDAERVAMCESGDDPLAVNSSSGDAGLWQFESATWEGTPYGHHSVFSARWSSLGAMWYWSRGEQSRWSCW